MPQRKLILRNWQCPGDIVMMTAAVRDLHLSYPGQFLTDVRTPCPQLWAHNPYITPLANSEAPLFQCDYPLIWKANHEPWHFVHGFSDYLNEKLGLTIRTTAHRGDIYLTEAEKGQRTQVEEVVGQKVPYWLLVSGGKLDVTVKWWAAERHQAVIDHFAGRILFVQVGNAGDEHPPLRGVVDLRGQTDLRQLVRLVYHCQGCVSPISLLMHLAAAVPCDPYGPKNRPCVVIAGGREPPHWVAYPHHQFLHRVGALRCCDDGGCWKNRVVPLGDGDSRDRLEERCVDVVELEDPSMKDPLVTHRYAKTSRVLPRCMHLVTVADVVRAIELYFEGGALRYLMPEQSAASRPHVRD